MQTIFIVPQEKSGGMERIMGLMFKKNLYRAGSGKRLTGMARYTEVLERDFKKLFLANLVTLVCFLPFAAGVVFSILTSSVLVLIPTCIVGGLIAGPALSCMYDSIFRGLRDASGKWWDNYRHAWKQNWRQALLPGVVFCLMLGFYAFMVMLFWWATRFPGWGTIAIFLFSLLLFTTFFEIYWPQVALFDQSAIAGARNCLLFVLRFPLKSLGTALLQLLYWTVYILFFPWSLFLLPLIGFWFILYTASFLLYNTFEQSFQLEEQIAEAFPEQAPYYEDDETWLKRKQAESRVHKDD